MPSENRLGEAKTGSNLFPTVLSSDAKSPLSIPLRGLYYVGTETYTECFSRIILCRHCLRYHRPEGSFRRQSNRRCPVLSLQLSRRYHRLTMSRRQA